MAATLYLIATPIGNLEDITLRALRTLRDEVSLIACEDTRQTQKLLEHYEIHKPLVSYHDHNEAARTPHLLDQLSQGESIALVSDAGTPLISDPGYRLVTAAIESGYPVVPIPGASAALAALTGSGLPVDQFRFIGFLPPKTTQRRKLFEDLSGDLGTIVAYESPHRILSTLDDLEAVLGTRRIVLARELTKVHEEFLRGTASDLRQNLQNRPAIKGEFTLLIAKADHADIPETVDPLQEIQRLQTETGVDRKEAIKAVAKRLGLPKREVYRLAAEQGSNPPDKRRD
ncbi:MAG TPA: 16S rRNA (cytidine(1402)-2'-O)-methyltransferase [Bryobacteraceae bacterium]|nr:16S rRNA (cytidine(1402)-2'-O)-methyltransferase [Bryobacteraceae bacterium]